jgi:hypothetical protein
MLLWVHVSTSPYGCIVPSYDTTWCSFNVALAASLGITVRICISVTPPKVRLSNLRRPAPVSSIAGWSSLTVWSVGIGRGCRLDKKGGDAGSRVFAIYIERHDLSYTVSDNIANIQPKSDENDDERKRMDWVKAFFRQVTARTSLVRPTMCDKGLTLDKNCSKRKSSSKLPYWSNYCSQFSNLKVTITI